MEAKIYTRNGSPWICTVCPNCSAEVHERNRHNKLVKFCCCCGQKIEFNNLNKVRHHQELNVNNSEEWTKLEPTKEWDDILVFGLQ